MKTFVKAFILCATILLSGCSNRIVINNAFVYCVNPDDYVYGCFALVGEACTETYSFQSVFIGEYSKEVTAVVTKKGQDAGYVFVSWSDGNTNPSRSDLAKNENCAGPIVFYAHFEKQQWQR